MGLLNKILGKTPAEVQTQVVVPENPVTFEAAVKEGPRVGMWVRTDEGVGILTGEGEVTLVRPDGTTLMEIVEDVAVPKKVVVQNVSQAYIEDIPLPRQGDIEFMRSLGYQNKEMQWL